MVAINCYLVLQEAGYSKRSKQQLLPTGYLKSLCYEHSTHSDECFLKKLPPIVGFKTSANELEIEIKVSANKHLDMAIWCFQPSKSHILKDLEKPLVLENQPVFFWTSETDYQAPADLFLYLVHGYVYTNRFIFPRKWKICSELDAYGLYVTFNGLESATEKVTI